MRSSLLTIGFWLCGALAQAQVVERGAALKDNLDLPFDARGEDAAERAVGTLEFYLTAAGS